MENIEIKAKISSRSLIHEKVAELEHKYVGMDSQTDTYFRTRQGRFKLRESALSGPYLVLYKRADKVGPKSSVYYKIPVDDAGGIKQILTEMLGEHTVIIKEREIFLYQNVRIHLDDVQGLGTFVEFEAVMDETYDDKEIETKKVEYLMHYLGIKSEDLIDTSYENLIRREKTNEDH